MHKSDVMFKGDGQESSRRTVGDCRMKRRCGCVILLKVALFVLVQDDASSLGRQRRCTLPISAGNSCISIMTMAPSPPPPHTGFHLADILLLPQVRFALLFS
ncbi:hypothetical protein D1007_04715 [Hordeum vulgare]|nr:hypothetical protein D1007_04715 [Hordeum vulgare]